MLSLRDITGSLTIKQDIVQSAKNNLPFGIENIIVDFVEMCSAEIAHLQKFQTIVIIINQEKTLIDSKAVRICQGCKELMENYNQSLLAKTNLIQQTRKFHSENDGEQSNVGGSDQEQQNQELFDIENQDKVNSLDDFNSNQDQILSQYKQKESQNKSQEVGGALNKEDIQLMKIYKKESYKIEEQNKNDNDIENFQKYMKKQNIQVEEVSEDSFLKKELCNTSGKRLINAQLKEYADYHIRQIVRETMEQYSIDLEKWEQKLQFFVKTAVSRVRPSSQYLNDSLNFNQFIKIKIINWVDNSKSAYLNGAVISSNIADKRMPTDIKNPKILILKDSLGFVKDEGTILNIASVIDQEEYYQNILIQKLSQIKPNVIIVEKDVSCKILDMIREYNKKMKDSDRQSEMITIICDLNLHKIKRIARYTQTILCPSTYVINSKLKLGQCEHFYVEQINKQRKLPQKIFQQCKNQNQNLMKTKQSDMISKEKSLIYLEGCNQALGCTILLSGNIYTELEELKDVKSALREMLPLARNVVLEKEFLASINCKIPRKINEDGHQVTYSPFQVTRNLPNRQTLVLSKVLIKKGAANLNSADESKQQALNNQGALDRSKSPHLDKINAAWDKSYLSKGVDETQQLGISPTNFLQQESQQNVNENFVKTKIDSMCGVPTKELMQFYKDRNPNSKRKQHDTTIGKFLFKLCKKASTLCEYCKEPMFKHTQNYYHKEGYVQISIDLQNKKHPSGQQINQVYKTSTTENEIMMEGECNICKKTVMSETKMSSLLFEYSTARFLEQFFYNENKLYNVECEHQSLQETTRKFIIHNNIIITMTYFQVDVYTIEMLRPITFDTSEVVQKTIENLKSKIEKSLKVAHDDLRSKIKNILRAIKIYRDEIIQVPSDLDTKLSTTNLPFLYQHLQTLKIRLNSSDQQIKELIQSGLQQVKECDTIFQGLLLERKLFLNLLTFAKVVDDVLLIACLVLVIMKRRMNVFNGKQNVDQSTDSIYYKINQTKNLGDSLQQSKNQINSSQIDSNESKHKDFRNMKNSTFILDANESLIHEPPQSIQQLSQQNSYQKCRIVQELFSSSGGNSYQNPNISQAHGSSQAIGMHNYNALNFTLKAQQSSNQAQSESIIKHEVEKLFSDIKQRVKAEQEFVIEGDKRLTIIDSFHRKSDKGDSPSSKNKSQRQSSKFTSSNKNSGNTQKDGKSNKFQNLSPMDDNSTDQFNPELYSQSWIQNFQNGFTTLPLGTDSINIPVKEDDIGSIIAFAFASNIYKEGLIMQNYMDIQNKIKGLGKQIRHCQGLQNINTSNSSSSEPMTTPAHQSGVNSSQGFSQSQLNNNYSEQDEHIQLFGKNDVLNSELTQHEVETEMLNGETLIFVINFSTYKQDMNMKIVRNGASTNVKSKLKFQTGFAPRRISGLPDYIANKRKNKQLEIYDLQYKVLPNFPKYFLGHNFYKESVIELDQILCQIKSYYDGPLPTMLNLSKQNISPTKIPGSEEDDLEKEERKDESALQNPSDGLFTPSVLRRGDQTTRKSFIQAQQQQNQNIANSDKQEKQEFCGIHPLAPLTKTKNTNEELGQLLNIPEVDFELKIYFPKKFEALRRYYCGSQLSFIQSLLYTKDWTTVSGGKTKSKFYKTFDDKYIYKEVKKAEFKMFVEFAPQYFDYLCTSFFHNYPCTLCKILGTFKLKITPKSPSKQVVKKYIFVTENMNFGIKPEDEEHIQRFDLKGSSLNRFVKQKTNRSQGVVLHDNNYLLMNKGRPLPLRYQMKRILQICINNDTLCLSKSNIVDYSLLTIIDKKRKKLRFGIIDYIQQYTLDKMFENKFKTFVSGFKVPTIIDPEKYKNRFKKAMKNYFVGMPNQKEKKSVKEAKEIDNDESDDQSEYNKKDKISKSKSQIKISEQQTQNSNQ